MTQFNFPITGGTVAPNAASGAVTTSGGIEILKKGKTLSPQMKITNIQVDFTQKTASVEIEVLPNPPFPGQTGRSSLVAHRARFGSEAAGVRRGDAQLGVQPGRRKSTPTEQRIPRR